METMEFEGKTTEEAIQNASKHLNLPVEDLDIDIIEPGSAGIFGLVGTKKAKIKVSYFPKKSDTDIDELNADFPKVIDFTGEDTTTAPPQPEVDLDQGDEIHFSKEVLEKILELIPMDTTVEAARADGNINLNILGDSSGLLIGRRGKTLDALQFIVNKIVNKSLEKKVRVVIDSEKYRIRRRESLTQMAVRMGEKAKRIRKPITTNPMNPGDRRIVHLALKDDGQLDTRSRGEGLMKKVVIIPRK
jgi:spoIIIJ-associated protein